MGDTPSPSGTGNEGDADLIQIKKDSDQAAWESAYTATENLAATSQGQNRFRGAFDQDGSATLPGLQLFWAEKENKLEQYDKDGDGLSKAEIDRVIEQAQPGKTVTSGVDRLFLSELRDKFDEIAQADGDGKTISLKDLQSAKDAALDKVKKDKGEQIVGAGDAVQITMTANDNARFNDLARLERLADGKSEQRISEKALARNISTLEGMIKRQEGGASVIASNQALKGVLEHMQKNFAKIAAASDDGGSGISLKDVAAYQKNWTSNADTQKDVLTLPKDVAHASEVKLTPVAKSVLESFKDVPITELDGRRPLTIVDGKAVARYGHHDLGFQFDDKGDLIAVFDNPKGKAVSGTAQTVFEREVDAKGKVQWYGRPNGLGNKEGQYKLPGALDVNPQTGAFVRMLSGEMGAGHRPKPGSAYESTETRILADGKKLTYQYTVEKNGIAFGHGWREDSTEPFRLIYRPSADAAWESLERQKDSLGNFTDTYRGNITCKGGVKVDGYEMSKPHMDRNRGTFSYEAYGLRHFHSREGIKTDGRLGGPDVKSVPHNGGTLYYVGQGSDLKAIKYQRAENGTTRNIYFDRALDGNGNQRKDERGVPLWLRSESKDATGKPVNPVEVAFKPYVNPAGKFSDTGRKDAPQRAGYVTVLDWESRRYYYVPSRRG